MKFLERTGLFFSFTLFRTGLVLVHFSKWRQVTITVTGLSIISSNLKVLLSNFRLKFQRCQQHVAVLKTAQCGPNYSPKSLSQEEDKSDWDTLSEGGTQTGISESCRVSVGWWDKWVRIYAIVCSEAFPTSWDYSPRRLHCVCMRVCVWDKACWPPHFDFSHWACGHLEPLSQD